MHRRTQALLAAAVAAGLLAGLPAPFASAATGGPDGGGYSFTDSTEPGGPAGGPFTSIAPANGGTGTDLGNQCDDCLTTYELPFALSFYDETTSTVQVSSNGNIQLLSNTNVYASSGLPDGRFDTVVEGYFKDLRTDAREGDGIFVQTSGSVGHRAITFEWRTTDFGAADVAEDFQIVLHEDSEAIDMRYLDVPEGAGDGVVGIQGADGSADRYLQYPSSLTDGLAVRFSRDVDGSATRTTLTATPADGSLHGQTVKLAAKVTPVASTGTAPTGTVTFYDGSSALGTVPVGTKGDARLSVRNLSTGGHQLAARYSGDSVYRSSANRALPYTVARADTTTTVSVPASGTVRYGDRGVTAQVRTRAPGRGTPTGVVYWYDNDRYLYRADLVRGRAILPTVLLDPGSHQLVASYPGDDDTNPSSSEPVALTLTKAGSTLTAKASPNPAKAAAKLTLSATLKVSSAAVRPGGDVVFSVDGQDVGSATVTNGKASYVLDQGLPPGTYNVAATYRGDPYVDDATGSVSLTVR